MEGSKVDTTAYVPVTASSDDEPEDDGSDPQLDEDAMWAAFLAGYKKGYSVESFDKNPIHRKTARSQFERWLKINYE